MNPAGVLGHSNTFWGIHPDSYQALPPGAQSKFTQDDIDVGFDAREIVFKRVVYGLEARDLMKFMPTQAAVQGGVAQVFQYNGAYLEAYQRQIEALRKDQRKAPKDRRIITPHLDTRWHDMLPLFWMDEAGVNLSLLQGVALGLFRVVNGRWTYQGWDELAAFRAKGALYGLKAALERRYDLLVEIGKAAAQAVRKDGEKHGSKLSRHRLINGVRSVDVTLELLHGDKANLLDLIMDYPYGNPSSQPSALEDEAFNLFQALVVLLETYVNANILDPDEEERRLEALFRDDEIGLATTSKLYKRTQGTRLPALQERIKAALAAKFGAPTKGAAKAEKTSGNKGKSAEASNSK